MGLLLGPARAWYLIGALGRPIKLQWHCMYGKILYTKAAEDAYEVRKIGSMPYLKAAVHATATASLVLPGWQSPQIMVATYSALLNATREATRSGLQMSCW